MSGLTFFSAPTLGGISILGVQYARDAVGSNAPAVLGASHTRGAGGVVMAFTGFAFTLYLAVALALIVTGFLMRRAAARSTVEA